MLSVLHFTHPLPGHILEKVNNDADYKCDACKTDGGGTRFQCNNCAYCMHDYCTMCPSSIPSFMHPHHPLTLAVTRSHRICHICNENVEGLFFFCQLCDDFNAHPLCTRLPQNLSHADHIHPLTLQTAFGPGGFCRICRDECPPCRYRCTICNLDIHIECISESGNHSSGDKQGGSDSSTRKRYRKKMYRIIGRIATGVVSSIIYGATFGG